MLSSVEPAKLLDRSAYVRELRDELEPSVLVPARSRIALVPLYVSIIVVAMLAIARGWVPVWTFPILSVAIGFFFACCTFLAHEALHGGITRDKRIKWVIGWIGFLPFNVSPKLWVAWHGQVHHGEAQLPGDPDRFPTLEEYKTQRASRVMVDYFSVGGRRLRGILTLAVGFSGQSLTQLLTMQRMKLTSGARTRIWAETILDLAVWATVAFFVGPFAFLFVYVLPLFVANAVVMAFILTNHSLSPLVAINDPLVNSLSVTVPRWLERLTINFGYHVEHHLYPAMSSRHAPYVRDLLLRRWPERYQSMSLAAALLAIHRTARVYKDAVTLIDPDTGDEYPVLLPGVAARVDGDRAAA